MIPDDVTLDELVEALRAGADGDRTRTAAVELLATHGLGRSHWLTREPLRALIEWWPADEVYDPPAMAVIDWAGVAELLATGDGLYDTGSERAVLGVACDLAAGWLRDAADRCDERNRALIVQAVRAALGGAL